MHPRSVPTDLPQLPTNLPQNSGHGLSVGAAIGIGIGIALVVLFCAVGAWIFVRRRRRTWASKKRKQEDETNQRDVEIAHVTPDEEITRRIREYEKDVKMWDEKRGNEVAGRAEWESEDEKEQEGDVEKTYELGPISPVVEVRNAQMAIAGKALAVELEGCSVVDAKSRQDRVGEETEKVYEIGQ
ncbi:hypothetical protein DE146DRAFT_524659 [Phaeosphaeria sp. MPI-PUGE-AT-0046c]|nr:hypothetical protein DE146DRAFT_524659 [Phaeosphaeria sp. MPI-PUGE-AT-0046c]